MQKITGVKVEERGREGLIDRQTDQKREGESVKGGEWNRVIGIKWYLVFLINF